MKRTAILLSGAMLVFSLAGALPAVAGTRPDGAIQGTWAWGALGVYIGKNQSNGTLTFDGNGGVTGIINYNYFGTNVCAGMALTGTYTVNPGKLTGTAIMTVSSVETSNCADAGDGDTLSLALSFANGLKTMSFVETDPYEAGYFADDFYAFSGAATHF